MEAIINGWIASQKARWQKSDTSLFCLKRFLIVVEMADRGRERRGHVRERQSRLFALLLGIRNMNKSDTGRHFGKMGEGAVEHLVAYIRAGGIGNG